MLSPRRLLLRAVDAATAALGRASARLREAAPPAAPPRREEDEERFAVVDPVTPEAAALRADLGRAAPPPAEARPTTDAPAPLEGSVEARAAAARRGL